MCKDQIVLIHWIVGKAREFQKNIYFCFNDFAKAFIWITTNCGTFLKRWEYKTSLSASWETCMDFKKQQWESDMEQWTGSKLGKEYVKAVYCHPGLFNLYVDYIMWNAGWPYTALTYSFPNFEPVQGSMSGSNSCFLTCIYVSAFR